MWINLTVASFGHHAFKFILCEPDDPSYLSTMRASIYITAYTTVFQVIFFEDY